MSYDRIDWAAGRFSPGDPRRDLLGYSYRVGRATLGKETDLRETQRADYLVELGGEDALRGDIAASRYVTRRRLNGRAFKPWYDEALGCWRTDIPDPAIKAESARQLRTGLLNLKQAFDQRRHR